MSGPVKGLLAPGLMEQPQRGLLDLLYPQGWRGGIFGMGNPTGAYLDQKELSRPGVNPGASPMSNRDLARQYAVNIGSGMGTDAGAPASIGAGLLGTVKMYHGTPHTFDAFDLSKIGTGEGAQAYGHGLYFAENPKTAKAYRSNLSQGYLEGTTGNISHGNAFETIVDAIKQSGASMRGSGDTARQIANHVLDAIEVDGSVKNYLRDYELPKGFEVAYTAAINKANELGLKPTKGALYTVEHPANPEDFLHWDKPLSEQSQQTRDAVAKILEKRGVQSYLTPDGERVFLDVGSESAMRGRDVYNIITDKVKGIKNPLPHKDAQAAASSALRKAGIPGIRYLDQGSRGTGEGTHNYVIFDDKPLKILSRE